MYETPMEITKQDLNKTVYVRKDRLWKHIDWYYIDATDMKIGRIATIIADHLIGKNKAHYLDFWNAWWFVVVTNISKMVWTGNKGISKKYHTYAGWKGNVKTIDLKTLFAKDPLKILWFAVRWMLPKNKIRDSRMKMLKMFAGSTHTYTHLPLKEIK